VIVKVDGYQNYFLAEKIHTLRPFRHLYVQCVSILEDRGSGDGLVAVHEDF
jgi:hypothetical protein